VSKKDQWMPLYVAEYLADTGHLTTTQHGAYLLLIMHYWRKRELPDDDKQLAAIAKLPLRIWLDCKETLQAFFYDGWRHHRIEQELSNDLKTGGDCLNSVESSEQNEVRSRRFQDRF